MTEVIKKRVLHQGRVFSLVREKVALPNGTKADMDLIRHPGAAATVPLREDRSVVMVYQYRHAIEKYIWEIPAGTLNPNESPLECAKRELIEETGYSADQLENIGAIIPLPGYSNEKIHIFVAQGLRHARQNLDPDEILRVCEIPLNEIMDMIERGVIKDGKTIAAMFFTKNWLEK